MAAGGKAQKGADIGTADRTVPQYITGSFTFFVQDIPSEGISCFCVKESGQIITVQSDGVCHISAGEGSGYVLHDIVDCMPDMIREVFAVFQGMHGPGIFCDQFDLQVIERIMPAAGIDLADKKVAERICLFRLQTLLDAETGDHRDQNHQMIFVILQGITGQHTHVFPGLFCNISLQDGEIATGDIPIEGKFLLDRNV